MIKINEVKLPVAEVFAAAPEERLGGSGKAVEELLRKKAAKLLGIRPSRIQDFQVLRRSLDARKKPELCLSYTVLLQTDIPDARLLQRAGQRARAALSIVTQDSYAYQPPHLPARLQGMDRERYFSVESHRPLVAGFGPAGIFAALLLARAGARPLVYERGASLPERARDVQALWTQGLLNAASNPQFGEGGAGAFSDGKLNTLVKDPVGRNRFVLETFVRHGADPDILLDAKPHIGTDRLLRIVQGIREEILSLGGEIHFHRKFTAEDYALRGERRVILALGHSARDSLEELFAAGLPMEAKDFAMGFRVQHPQSIVDAQQYGNVPAAWRSWLGPASYSLRHRASDGRSVYSFCMCPGGYVLDASSEAGRLCVNGMSYHGRDGENANAAIIVGIRKEDFGGDRDPLGGVKLQRILEERAYRLGNGRIPVQRYGAFREALLPGWNIEAGKAAAVEAEIEAEKAAEKEEASPEFRKGEQGEMRKEGETKGEGDVYKGIRPMFRGRYQEASLEELFFFPEDSAYGGLRQVNADFVEAMEHFGRQIPGFARADAILAGVESRTSSPVRMPRDAHFLSAVPGIYPCGEGAGYAGGIMSAAMDGMKAAEAVLLDLKGRY